MLTLVFTISYIPSFDTFKSISFVWLGLIPEGKIIATDTRLLAWVSVQVVTKCDIPHVHVGGLRFDNFFFILGGALSSLNTGGGFAATSDRTLTLVSVGNKRPFTYKP